MLQFIALALGELTTELVFVGGTAMQLYADHPNAPEIRVAEDIDCIVSIESKKKYRLFGERLQEKGFQLDQQADAPAFRWLYETFVLDVMPLNEKIMGFNNDWYSKGFKNTFFFTLPNGKEIRLFNTAYFLASKIEAWEHRSNRELRWSPDFEDIVYILNNRKHVIEEVQGATGKVKRFLIEKIKDFLNNPNIEEGIFNVLPAPVEDEAIKKVYRIMQKIAEE